MIDPTEFDIGRLVLYRHHFRSIDGGIDVDQGVITSFNEKYVFVRYDGDVESEATFREELDFAN